MPRNPKVEFDMLKMYFGRPYVIDLESAYGKITVYSPTIGDIVDIGETKFYQTLSIFTGNTTQYRVMLWDIGIDWNEISDFQLFAMLYQQIDPDVSKLLFGDLDFKKFQPLLKKMPKKEDSEETSSDESWEEVSVEEQSGEEQSGEDKSDEANDEELILWNDEDQVEINAEVHNHFSQYLRAVFNSAPEEKITNNATLKQWYINKDKRALERAREEEIKNGSRKTTSIQPIISACVNHPGFKYNLKELNEVGVMEFYDSVSRLQIYEQSTALMKGMYSGFISAKDIKPEDYNFMREIVRDTNNSVSKASKMKQQG